MAIRVRPARTQDEVTSAYQHARITGLKSGLAILALMNIVALLLTKRIPKVQPGSEEATADVRPSPAATG